MHLSSRDIDLEFADRVLKIFGIIFAMFDFIAMMEIRPNKKTAVVNIILYSNL